MFDWKFSGEYARRGADDTMRRIINENSRQLSFDQSGFEEQ
jgi:hypothetical protein